MLEATHHPPPTTHAVDSLAQMDPHEYCQTKPPKAARASTTASCSCRRSAGARSPRSTRSAARWMTSSTNARTRRWHARSSRGGATSWRRRSTARPQHPVARALAEVAPRYNLSEARLNEIIDGMEMDLQHNRYPDFEALKLYCHRVAGVVGLLSAEIFGYQDRRTLEYAADLGMAFQLTNIIRDVGEDARRDRIYLPLDELARYGVGVPDILQRAADRLVPAAHGIPDRARAGLLPLRVRQAAGNRPPRAACRDSSWRRSTRRRLTKSGATAAAC